CSHSRVVGGGKAMFIGKRVLATTFVTLALATPSSRAVDQKRVNDAIDLGVKVVRGMQLPHGGWPHALTGATSLGGLTLLECGAAANDPAVEAAAKYVRFFSPGMTETYSISLAILFLDRLDDVRDLPLIESLTVRLLFGQRPDGGWHYNCP